MPRLLGADHVQHLTGDALRSMRARLVAGELADDDVRRLLEAYRLLLREACMLRCRALSAERIAASYGAPLGPTLAECQDAVETAARVYRETEPES